MCEDGRVFESKAAFQEVQDFVCLGGLDQSLVFKTVELDEEREQ